MILQKFVSYFSSHIVFFYAFLNFIQFSGNVKEIENSKTRAHCAGPTLAHGLGTIGPTHKPFQTDSMLGRRGAACSRDHHMRHTRGGALTDGPVVTDRRQGLARKHHGVSGWRRARWGRRGSHRRGGSMMRGEGRAGGSMTF
jgi:hypothetical protein